MLDIKYHSSLITQSLCKGKWMVDVYYKDYRMEHQLDTDTVAAGWNSAMFCDKHFPGPCNMVSTMYI